MFPRILVPLMLVLCATAMTVDRRTLFERTGLPAEWSLDPASPAPTESITWYLPFSAGPGLHTHLLDVAMPLGRHYGQWLDRDALMALSTPPQQATDDATAWLSSCGVAPGAVDRSVVDGWVVSASVKKVECLFQTKVFNATTQASGKGILVAMGPVSIPQNLEGVIPFVAGISDLPLPRKTKRERKTEGTEGEDTGETRDRERCARAGGWSVCCKCLVPPDCRLCWLFP